MVKVILIVIIVILLIAVVALLYFQNQTVKKFEKSKSINSNFRIRIAQQDSQNRKPREENESLNSQVRELSFQASGPTAGSENLRAKKNDERVEEKVQSARAETEKVTKKLDESNEKLRDSYIANKKSKNTAEMWESQAKKYASENERLKSENSRFRDVLNRMRDYPELQAKCKELREQNRKLSEQLGQRTATSTDTSLRRHVMSAPPPMPKPMTETVVNSAQDSRSSSSNTSEKRMKASTLTPPPTPKSMVETASTEKRPPVLSPPPVSTPQYSVPPLSPKPMTSPSETPASIRSSTVTESVVSYSDVEKRKSGNYLELCCDIEALDKMDDVQYLSAKVSVSGSVIIGVAGGYRNADVMMLPEGEILPNPYNYTSLLTNGELGSRLKRLSPCFPSARDLAEDRYYVMTAIVPAQCEKQGSNSYQLIHSGEITFACLS